jgi:glycosyltransferase involved in cell wall biosynthesis
LVAVHQGGGIGGAPVSLLKLLASLDRADVQSQAVFTERGEVLAYAADLGVPARVVPTGGAFFYSAHARPGPRMLARFIRTFPGAVRTARGVLVELRPDLVHLNTSVLLAWGAAARRERLPVVWTVREVPGPDPRVRRWHSGFILRHARQVVAVSDFVRACFPPSRQARIRRVYNAVDLREFQPAAPGTTEDVLRELGVPAGVRLVTMLGAVQREKGHWLMLEALRRLPSDVHLLLVCGGVDAAYGQSLRGKIKRGLRMPLDHLDALLRDAGRLGLRHRLHVTGFRHDVPRMLTITDVLAFPSLQPEGFGRPIIEAMAMARPVVATSVGPSAEILGADAGRVVAPESARLADAVAELLRDSDLRARMGAAGRSRVEREFSLERQVAAMQRIYRQARPRA